MPTVLVEVEQHQQSAHEDSSRQRPNQDDHFSALLPGRLTRKTQFPQQVDD
jgi:hypothetical protein